MDTISDIQPGIQSSTAQELSDYDLISGLFIYPQNNSYAKRGEEVYNHFSVTIPEAAEVMKPFTEFITNSTVQEMQELFLRSFDVQAITTLDIGFTLFGEDYKRGQLLVNLNREHREAGNDCHTELSDHLPNILRLLPKMKDETMRNEIALRLLIPAVEKMINEFEGKKIEKKDEIYKKNLKTVIEYSPVYRTVYQSLLQALFIALKNDFGYEPYTTEVPSGVEEQDISILSCSDKIACNSCNPVAKDYSGNIEIEMNIEKY
jgi:nitrate reductase assembly molybdenum cofactor insertion protein NarJ